MKYLITGGAGFIGSTMADRLVQNGHNVIIYDNFTTGQREFLSSILHSPNLKIINGDLLDLSLICNAMENVDFVYHFAANADVRYGINHPDRDLKQNTIATFNVLEAMRKNEVKRIFFSSTGSIYGEPIVFPTPEDAPFPTQTSLYGASKLACEGLISAYCSGFEMSGVSFRFVSVLGERYTHGHIFDFCKKLLNDPDNLQVLGDGRQRKSYMYVHDCIDAMRLVEKQDYRGFDVFNLGCDDYIEVNQSIRWIVEEMALNPNLTFTGGPRGWIGDSPFIYLATSKIRNLGWSPSVSIKESVKKTTNWLLENKWALGGDS